MNISVASLNSSISAERLWLSSTRYILAGESPLRYDDGSDDCESVLSIQAKETDYAKDTSDTDSDDSTVEYEPVTVTEAPSPDEECSSTSSEQIIATRVISVVAWSGTEAPADESAADDDSDAELGPHDYWRCVQCNSRNNNPRYRYCERCFKVRKTLLPPRPKRRVRPTPALLRHDCDSAYSSQELPGSQQFASTTSQEFSVASAASQELLVGSPGRRGVKRPAAVDLDDSKSDSELSAGALADAIGAPKCKDFAKLIGKASGATIHAPALSICNSQAVAVKIHSKEWIDGRTETKTDKSRSERDGIGSEDSDGSEGVDRLSRQAVTTLAAAAEDSGFCVVCCERPKSGVFVHGRVAHICCCYQCARRVFATTRRCPVCNRSLTAVLRAVVS